MFGQRIGFAINMVSQGPVHDNVSNAGLTEYTLAAMPSLHFGYSLLIGLTIMTIPLPHKQHILADPSGRVQRFLLRLSWRRLVCCLVGFFYPLLILVAIVATANHFILDAIAGAFVCAMGWSCNGVLLNLLPLEDYFLSILRIHKPDCVEDAESDEP